MKNVENQVENNSDSLIDCAPSFLSCYHNDNVPNTIPTMYSEMIPEDVSGVVLSELKRNQRFVNSNGEVEGSGVLTVCDPGYLSMKRKEISRKKKMIIENKDLEAGRSLYRSKMKSVDGNGFVCISQDGKLSWVSYKRSSRYFEEGRKKIISTMFHRYKKMSTSKTGVLLTLTYDPKKIDIWDAWSNVGSHCRGFMKNLNRHRSRHYKRIFGSGKKTENLSFFRVVEFHKNGYPHVHYYFPNLRWLWHHSKGKKRSVKNLKGNDVVGVFDIWGWGRTEVKATRGGGRLSNYVTKYLRKFDSSNEDAMVFMWLTGIRLFSFSKDFQVSDDIAADVGSYYLLGSCSWVDMKNILYKIKYAIRLDDLYNFGVSEDNGCRDPNDIVCA